MAEQGIQQVVNYNNASNFTFNTDKASFLPLVNPTHVELAPAVYTDEEFFASFDNATMDADRVGSGDVTAINNNAAITSGKLALEGSSKYVDYGSVTSIPTNIGTIRFKFTPSFTGNPSAVQYLFQTALSGPSSSGELSIQLWIDGIIRVDVSTSAGAKTQITFGSVSPVAGEEILVELNHDFVLGVSRMFVNGVQSGATSSLIIDRGAISNIRLGNSRFGTNTPDFKLDEVRLFSTVQHVADFSGDIPLVFPTKYLTDAVNVLVDASISMDDLLGFKHVAVLPSSTGIRYNFLSDTGGKYWFNGAVFEVGDGSWEQSNTVAEIVANIDNDDLSDGVTGQINALLKTDDGLETPQLSQATVTYSTWVAISLPGLCTVYGYILDAKNDPVSGATVEVLGDNFVNGDNVICQCGETTSRTNGYFELVIGETITSNKKLSFYITYTHASGREIEMTLSGVVPNTTQAALTSFAS